MAHKERTRSYFRYQSVPANLLPTVVERDGREGEGNPELDEEMEKMFRREEDKKGEEWLAQISEGKPPAPRNLTDHDFNFHRKKSYPHMHAPLKALHSKRKRAHSIAMLRKSSTGAGESDSIAPVATLSITRSPVYDEEELSPGEELILSDETPTVSERASARDTGIQLSPDRRVQFDIGKTLQGSPDIDEDKLSDPLSASPLDDATEEGRRELEKKRRRHWRQHHHHHHRKHSLIEDPGWRKRSGIEALPRRMSEAVLEETSNLQEMDQDDIVSHRFDISKGKRRFSVRPKDSMRKESIPGPKKFDHSPHEVFVQLDELTGIGPDREWKETARWIKYEEDVEEGAERWGRPHVASLSFHSLLNLRKCLETGVILLDLEEKELPGVVYRVVEQMATDELISDADKAVVMRALLLRHRHVQETESRGFRFNVRRNTSSYSSLQNLNEEARKRSLIPSASAVDTTKANLLSPPNLLNHTTIDIKEETYLSSTEDLARRVHKESILKRIPVGAEATTVLVGSVEFLEQPTIAFIRLAEGILIPSITEVLIPVRFMFICLGPPSADLDYHEIGRSISTLMSNPEFHIIAYKASGRKELLSAINEFLDCSIVLPPGNWDRNSLLPFDDLKAKSDAIRRRQSRATQPTEAEKKALISGEEDEDGWKKKAEDDPLRRTKYPWGGLYKDIKRRFPHYISDFTDGINGQCIAAAIFMYFAALSGAITFGGLMADKTDNLVGISETLIATALSGILFALLAGQPLVIVGATGPLLLFDESLYTFCTTSEIDYLTMRVYIGIWLFVIALMVSFFEGSVLVKLFTRFTEEIFASLISLLYIVESVMKVCLVYNKHPLMTLMDYAHGYCMHTNDSLPCFYTTSMLAAMMENVTGMPLNMTSQNSTLAPVTDRNFTGIRKVSEMGHKSPLVKRQAHISWTQQNALNEAKAQQNNGTNVPHMNTSGLAYGPLEPVVDEPNTALFCTILALGTFFIAYYLRQFRNSKFLGRSARRALGDFGVPIAIVVMVGLDYITPGVYTEKLKVPEGLSPTAPDVRSWIIPPTGLVRNFPVWVAFAAIVPALLVYILLFMETHISELIIAKKERKLKKGSGFHLDIVLICLLNVGCGFMGAPFICAATVRSVTHVSAVTVMSRTHAPGDKPHIIEVKEQRVSALLVAILVGLSVLMSPLLRLVPMAVLFGVFLYMGISSINGIQFFERCRLFFMPVKHHPQVPYVRRVPTLKMHLFTLIQLGCLVVLWVVKSSGISLAFPFFLILMLPLRAQMRFMFTPQELRALDSDEPDKEEEEEPDFYTEALLAG
ncbi:Band 3 cytoplasmic domain [Nesidiocoris tenuis]|uniref:Anion exchange protein n=1 Tax=Nesidiocoris tenuis TaxID=355587 RepID=A0ABN7B102_9HEMI|nr:Band 3 cytoplasmic domain [Nesidiocoris tenuis]